jgi:integrase
MQMTLDALMAIPGATPNVVIGWWRAFDGFRTSKASRCAASTVASVGWYCWPVAVEAVTTGIAIEDYKESDFAVRQARRKQAGTRNNTLRKEVMLNRGMFGDAVRARLIKRDPLRDYKMASKVRPHIACPTPDGFVSLLMAARDHYRPSVNPGAAKMRRVKAAAMAARDVAMVMLQGRCALRPCELNNLQKADYHPKEGYIVIETAKDNEPRRVPIYGDVIQYVDAWLKVRWACETDYLFISDRGDRIKVDWWSKHFKSFAKAAGMPEVTPRGLRHYGLTEAAKVNLLAASAAAGHSSPATTRNYLHNNFEHTKEALSSVPQVDTTKLAVPDGRRSKRVI